MVKHPDSIKIGINLRYIAYSLHILYIFFMEKWKPIPEFEGIYEISTLGRIKSLARRTYTSDGRPFKILKEKILKPTKSATGYNTVLLCNNCKKSLKLVHRLVMLTFVGPSDLYVNHKNLIKTDNRLDNLEYVNQKENFEHAFSKGACFNNHGEKCHASKLSNKDRRFIIENEGKLSSRELAKILNISIDSIRYYWKKSKLYKKMLLNDFKSL